MTALAEALLAAQRQAIGALSKAYIAGAFEDDGDAGLLANLDRIGATDAVDQGYLRECLDTLRTWGAPSPQSSATQQKSHETELASDAQANLIRKLADERGTVAPDYRLTKQNASKVIEELKAGTYNPDSWSVPV